MRSFQVLLATAFSCLLAGCIVVRGDNLTFSSKWPLQDGISTKKIALSISGSNINPRTLQLVEGQAQKAYTDSSLFSHVSVVKEPSDLIAEIRVREEGSRALAGISGFGCGFTMGLIPGYATATLNMETVFKNPSGAEIGSIKQSESVSLWMQLLLIFAMPFRDEPNRVVRELYYDLHRATLDKALKDGYLLSDPNKESK